MSTAFLFAHNISVAQILKALTYDITIKILLFYGKATNSPKSYRPYLDFLMKLWSYSFTYLYTHITRGCVHIIFNEDLP